MLDKAFLFIVAFIFSIAANILTIYAIENVSVFTSNNSGLLRNIYYIFSMFFQLIAISLGAYYFFKNKAHDQTKLDTEKRNNLLNHLVQEYKTTQTLLNRFFYLDFNSDQELKKFKDSTVEHFSLISTFVEANENLFIFNDNDMKYLLTPSSVIQTNNSFSLASIKELKKHDLSFLKSEFSTSIMLAYKTCWNYIQ